MDPVWDAELRVWDAKNFGPVSPGTHRNKFVKKSLTMLKSLNVCKVYLLCGIVIQRVVTKHGLPSIQLSRMMNLKIEFAKNKCLGTIWSTEMNPIA